MKCIKATVLRVNSGPWLTLVIHLCCLDVQETDERWSKKREKEREEEHSKGKREEQVSCDTPYQKIIQTV
jgi:hypothetical protein